MALFATMCRVGRCACAVHPRGQARKIEPSTGPGRSAAWRSPATDSAHPRAASQKAIVSTETPRSCSPPHADHADTPIAANNDAPCRRARDCSQPALRSRTTRKLGRSEPAGISPQPAHGPGPAAGRLAARWDHKWAESLIDYKSNITEDFY